MSTVAFDFGRSGAPERPIDRLNQLVVVAGILVPGVAALAIADLPGAIATIAIPLVALPLIHSGWPGTALRLLAATILFLLTGWSNWVVGSHDLASAAVAALRVASVALPGLLLSAHIAPFPLGDALMQQLR
ncbi:MAG: hypothetical protein QM604_08030, partial [Microbacterium sp.]